jgi:hypothetical protein
MASFYQVFFSISIAAKIAACRFYGKAPFSVKPLHTKRLYPKAIQKQNVLKTNNVK